MHQEDSDNFTSEFQKAFKEKKKVISILDKQFRLRIERVKNFSTSFYKLNITMFSILDKK